MTVPSRRALALAAVMPLAAVQGAVHAADLSAVPSGIYANDPTHSYITFSYSHLGLSEPVLAFDEFEIRMELDNAEPAASSVSVTIDPQSVVTGSDIFHEHLTGADWLDVSSHPEITFVSRSIEAAGDGAYRVSGDLTIKGEARPVAFNMAINAAMNHPLSGDPVVGVSGSAEVLRSDFGLGNLAPAVSDEVTIDVTAEMILQEESVL